MMNSEFAHLGLQLEDLAWGQVQIINVLGLFLRSYYKGNHSYCDVLRAADRTALRILHRQLPKHTDIGTLDMLQGCGLA